MFPYTFFFWAKENIWHLYVFLQKVIFLSDSQSLTIIDPIYCATRALKKKQMCKIYSYGIIQK
jgi:hypothetical protein